MNKKTRGISAIPLLLTFSMATAEVVDQEGEGVETAGRPIPAFSEDHQSPSLMFPEPGQLGLDIANQAKSYRGSRSGLGPTFDEPAVAVPEPGTLGLLVMGLALLGIMKGSRKI